VLCVEFVEPGIEASHPLTAIELGGDGTLGESRDVQPGAPRPLVEVVGEADVPTGHTQRIHIRAGSSPYRSAGTITSRAWDRLSQGRPSDANEDHERTPEVERSAG
jgi:hypothetical protein